MSRRRREAGVTDARTRGFHEGAVGGMEDVGPSGCAGGDESRFGAIECFLMGKMDLSRCLFMKGRKKLWPRGGPKEGL